ncbi:hypothetical protein EHEL_070995 [Encephalitozoon hellem ATCC 50504]|uniref:Uncharacterized protein n=1 Tax=Encephalitozoon hellem TaxID=27973 RepID=A0A9Q9CAX7_ENCHE|nr:uncharacterized protein EHEL_070995 [Encephalitozoon hellem ATCC 50504]AHL28951.1 hypothetical protein EHEL_070995 [Encephalitozoon hellem ATCC 50504]UTX43573.1 hypothetical protein GPU96_07g13340 [Encephalitozoon hellem]WEL39048.1 hypothetical protein PFJ87_07g01260 [Encephalitozoon hellem]
MWVLLSLAGFAISRLNPDYGKGIEIEMGDRLIESINSSIEKFKKLTGDGFFGEKIECH